METEIVAVAADIEAAAAVTATGRCTRQLALTAVKSAKFPSSLLLASLYTAGTATRSTRSPAATKAIGS